MPSCWGVETASKQGRNRVETGSKQGLNRVYLRPQLRLSVLGFSQVVGGCVHV